jgi:hypothetical protein
MTREAFIKELDKEGYSYEIEGDKVIVDVGDNVYLEFLTSLPSSGVEFRNRGIVNLKSLKSIPPGVEFRNIDGDVLLRSIIDGWIWEWEGNIEGISSNTLFNGMIKRGMFL